MKDSKTPNASLVDRIRVATPCPARWEDMDGDERARFCSLCQKHVYNFSAMAPAEITALVRQTEGRICARYHRRSDGRMLTADCPVGAGRSVTRVKQMLASALAASALVFNAIAGASLSRPKEEPPMPKGKLARKADEVKWQVKEWLGINPPTPVLMGKVCVVPPPTSTVTPPSNPVAN